MSCIGDPSWIVGIADQSPQMTPSCVAAALARTDVTVLKHKHSEASSVFGGCAQSPEEDRFWFRTASTSVVPEQGGSIRFIRREGGTRIEAFLVGLNEAPRPMESRAFVDVLYEQIRAECDGLPSLADAEVICQRAECSSTTIGRGAGTHR